MNWRKATYYFLLGAFAVVGGWISREFAPELTFTKDPDPFSIWIVSILGAIYAVLIFLTVYSFLGRPLGNRTRK